VQTFHNRKLAAVQASLSRLYTVKTIKRSKMFQKNLADGIFEKAQEGLPDQTGSTDD
jgi:hypothetical protein